MPCALANQWISDQCCSPVPDGSAVTAVPSYASIVSITDVSAGCRRLGGRLRDGRNIKSHAKKVRKARAKHNAELARKLAALTPTYRLDHLVKER